MEKRSLGLIETWGITPAIEAADAGSKAANVAFLGYEQVTAGLITIRFTGDVAAVKAAVSAGAAAAAKVGKVVACHVIARPNSQIPLEPERPATPEPVTQKPQPDEDVAVEDKGKPELAERPPDSAEPAGEIVEKVEVKPPPKEVDEKPPPKEVGEKPHPKEVQEKPAKKEKPKKKKP